VVGDHSHKRQGMNLHCAAYTVSAGCPSVLEVGRDVARKSYEDGIIKLWVQQARDRLG